MTDAEKTKLFAHAPEAFLRRLEKAGDCIEWRGTVMQNGYGLYKPYIPKTGKQTFLAHRIAYHWYTGEDLSGKVVRHHCDNRRCVNPLHLASGTHADNSQDMVDRGRSARGERSGKAKLTTVQVQEIRQKASNGERHWVLAQEYGVCRSAITLAVNGKRWKHLANTYAS